MSVERVDKPWGYFEVLQDSSSHKVKLIVVHPGQQLSYQSHEKREEHWIVVRGKGVFTLDEKPSDVKVGSVLYIPTKSKHRIRNNGTEELHFVEVQLGSYFGEDDIRRYEDDYGRN